MISFKNLTLGGNKLNVGGHDVVGLILNLQL